MTKFLMQAEKKLIKFLRCLLQLLVLLMQLAIFLLMLPVICITHLLLTLQDYLTFSNKDKK